MTGFPRPATTARLLPALALAFVAACGSSANGNDAPPATTGGSVDGALTASRAPGAGSAQVAGTSGTAAASEASQPRSGEALVIVGTDTVVAEVARTAAEREKGLMEREEVPDGTGMLFVFEDEAVRSFWMKDTYVALDVAYINADFRIVSIHALEPLDTSPVASAGPAMFALEVRQNWFAEHGIEAGDTVQIVFGG